jgi:Tfp pilus assembly protein PilV
VRHNVREEGRGQRKEGKGTHGARVPGVNGRSSASGLTLVEVLMSMMVTGIGILGVVALFPLAFVRAVQATNLTNGTILRYNAESLLDANPRLLLQWQANQQYQLGDLVLVPNSPLVGFVCTTAGTSDWSTPTWNTTLAPPGTTNDGSVVWTVSNTAPIPPARYVVDPLGWYSMSATPAIQAYLGNNGAGAPYANSIQRFTGEVPNAIAASVQAYLPDSWVEQARAPLTTSTATSATLQNVNLGELTYTTPQPAATAPTPYTISRVVLIDATGKFSQTRIITGFTAPSTVSWSANDPLTGTFVAATARVETQEMRYTWLLTIVPNPGGGTSSVVVTVFFHRALSPLDEQAYTASGADGVLAPFTVTYSGTKPFVKKGSFLFDCVFGRWYRVVNVVNDTGTSMQVFVDQSRPQADVLAAQAAGLGQNFGAVFMRGIVDVFPLPLKP